MAYEFVDEPTSRYEFVDAPKDEKLTGIRGEAYDKAMNYNGKDAMGGLTRGAGSFGATFLTPYDLIRGNTKSIGNPERRSAMDDALRTLGADPDSMGFKTNKLLAEIAGTSGIGGVVGNALEKVPFIASKVPALIDAIKTYGMSANGVKGVGGVATRMGGGAVTGGLSAGAVNPEDAGTGAMIGGAFPAATMLAGKTGQLIGNSIRGKGVAPEVKELAQKAKSLGVDIPADRLVDSKPMNALASGLNYVPFSGRAASEAKMNTQLNQALSKTFGQDSSNVTMALRKANTELGSKFDDTLKSTGLKFDKTMLDDISQVYNKAESELSESALKPITAKINDLMAKGESGVIDGQAAYNIKRELDRIGRGTGPEAWHALELKGKLMEALDRSLGESGAAAFAKTRQQYGNMLSLEKLAKNGVDGEISVARLANMQNINNKPLQDIADIAAQFVKPREAQHGAMQRGFAAVGIGGAAGLPALGGTVAAGRLANTALNSNALKNFMMKESSKGLLGNAIDDALPLMYRTNPLVLNGLIGQ
jgi:hypothetical protein